MLDKNIFNSTLYHEILEVMHQGLILVDPDSHITLWNRWMEQHSGIVADNAKNHTISSVFNEQVHPSVLIAIDNALKHGLPTVLSNALHGSPLPLHAKSKDSSEYIQQSIHIFPVGKGKGKRHALIQVADVTLPVNRENMLRAQTSVLQLQATTDGLTGVHNRRFFDERFELEFRRAQRQFLPIALIMLDIDFFKAYNDFYGHPEADKMLVQIANTVRSLPRRATDMVARYGGEEFIVLLPDCNLQQAMEIGEELHSAITALNTPHECSEISSRVTVSVGVSSQKPNADSKPNALLSAVDKALYLAKKSGRNRIESIFLDS